MVTAGKELVKGCVEFKDAWTNTITSVHVSAMPTLVTLIANGLVVKIIRVKQCMRQGANILAI